jgi:hypothetical protein
MKHVLTIAALTIALLPGTGASAATTAAMPSCAAGDPVVWVNTKSKVYHLPGDPYYGNTKAGKYACKSDADAAGDHAPKGSAKTARTHRGKAAPAASPDPSAT